MTCVEADGGLIGLLQRTVWPSGPSDPAKDNRVRLVQLDPACAVQARPGAYDVIVADTDPAESRRERPIYARVLRGSQPAARRRRNLRPAISLCRFWAVARVECSGDAQIGLQRRGRDRSRGGDFVLLASNSTPRDQPARVVRPLSDAPSETHARAGRLGLVGRPQLGRLSRRGLRRYRSGSDRQHGSQRALRLPLAAGDDALGAEREELAQVLNPYAGRIAEWPGVEGNDPEFLRGSTTSCCRRELMTAYPDQPWAYRKSVHEELKKHPHSVITEAEDGYERKLHPVDRHRLEYLTALGRAAQTRRPSLERFIKSRTLPSLTIRC